jgi:hypothetical protein
MLINSRQTAELPGDDTVYYDIELYQEGLTEEDPEIVHRIMEGTMAISAEVTRP